VRRIIELSGADESLIGSSPTDQAHDRHAYFARLREGRGARLARRQRAFEQGIERTVAWYRENEVVVASDPRQVPTASTTSDSTGPR